MTDHKFYASAWELLNRLRGRTGDLVETQSASLTAWISAWLLLLWAEREDMERQATAAFEGKEYEPLFTNRYWFQTVSECDLVPRSFGYEELQRQLKKEDGNPIRANLRLMLLNPSIEELFRRFLILDEANSWLIEWLGKIDFSENEGLQTASDVLDLLLSGKGRHALRGEYYTPSPVVDLMVNLVEPQPGESIYDPCFGSGSILVECARRIKNAAYTVSAGEWKRLRSQTIFGNEINPLAVVIASARIVLAGISEPKLQLGNALERIERFDIILANPPWGGKINYSDLTSHFRIRATDTSNLFLQHVMQSLRPGGRAVVVVPESTLFGSGPDKLLRQNLLTEFKVEGIISLAEGTFLPSSGIKANLLFFRKAPSSTSVKFLKVSGLAGEQQNTKDSKVLPQEVLQRFKSTQYDFDYWQTPIKDIKKRNWELIAKRSGEEQLGYWLQAIIEDNPNITVQPLERIAHVISGVSYDKRRSLPVLDTEDKVGVIRISDIRRDEAISPKLFLTPDAVRNIRPEQLLRPKDILVSKSGTIGKLAIYRFKQERGRSVSGNNLIVIRPHDTVLVDYLAILLEAPVYQSWMSGHARGSTIQHLSISALRQLPIPIPSLQFQERLVKTYRTRGRGDPVAMLVEITSTGDIAAQTSQRFASVATVIAEVNSMHLTSDALSMIEKFASVYSTQQVLDSMDDDWWTQWHADMKRLMIPLQGISHVSRGSALFAILQNASRDLKARRSHLESIDREVMGPDEATLWNESMALTVAVEKPINETIGGLLEDVRVDITPKQETILTGVKCEVGILIRNRGSLPLRNLAVSTDPEIGSVNLPFFAESAESSFSLSPPSQVIPGKFEFVIAWRAERLDGSSIDDRLRIALQVHSTQVEAHMKGLGPSPYVTGDPVHEEMFYGRKEILDKIERQLLAPRHANVILLEGNRRSGKTSILQRLGIADKLRGWIPVYCSFQAGSGHDKKSGLPTKQVFIRLAIDIFKAVSRARIRTWFPDRQMPTSTDFAFETAFVDAANEVFSRETPFEFFDLYLQSVLRDIAPRRLLLMLDEFDTIQEGIESGVTSPRIPGNIRYFLHTYESLSAILSYTRFLRRHRQEYWSALFGLGYPVQVGSLGLEDARLLVTHPAEGKLVFTDTARDRIVELCARQPYLIQLFCNHIFEAAAESNQRAISEAVVADAAASMALDCEQFETLWRDFIGSERRKYILGMCVALQALPDPITLRLLEVKLEEAHIIVPRKQDLGDDLAHLRELELLTMDDQGAAYRIAIPLMVDWIRKNHDLEDLRRRAVEESEKQT